jgi:hypothetical protein
LLSSIVLVNRSRQSLSSIALVNRCICRCICRFSLVVLCFRGGALASNHVGCPKGHCSLGEDCMCPAGELRPKHKCKLCGAQLHNVTQNCAAVCDDDEVMCKVNFGCDAQKPRACETAASHQSPTRTPCAWTPRFFFGGRCSVEQHGNGGHGRDLDCCCR